MKRFTVFKFRDPLYTWSLWGLYNISYYLRIIPKIDFYQKSFLRRDYTIKSLRAQLCLSLSSEAFIKYLQKWLHTLVLEEWLSTLGSLICPTVWTLAIRQVARQLLPRVRPEKAYSEVPHRYRWFYSPTPAIHLWLASLCNLLSQIGGACIGFLSQQILASTYWWSLQGYKSQSKESSIHYRIKVYQWYIALSNYWKPLIHLQIP